jgi:DNA-binding transcriptional ArsR family regulator
MNLKPRALAKPKLPTSRRGPAPPHDHDACGPHGLAKDAPLVVSDEAFERAAALFRAAGDLARLRLLHKLDTGEHCVSELALASETKLSTLSQQLRVLHQERIVKRRRDGKHIFYSLADDHVRELIRAALQHADEPHR